MLIYNSLVFLSQLHTVDCVQLMIGLIMMLNMKSVTLCLLSPPAVITGVQHIWYC